MSALYGNWFWECRGHTAFRYSRPFSWERLNGLYYLGGWSTDEIVPEKT